MYKKALIKTAEFSTGEFSSGEYSAGKFTTGEFDEGEFCAGEFYEGDFPRRSSPSTLAHTSSLILSSPSSCSLLTSSVSDFKNVAIFECFFNILFSAFIFQFSLFTSRFIRATLISVTA